MPHGSIMFIQTSQRFVSTLRFLFSFSRHVFDFRLRTEDSVMGKTNQKLCEFSIKPPCNDIAGAWK